MKETAISMWHPCGTVKMGKVSEEGTCVDTDFKVMGIRNLRVADMSVAPFLLRYVDLLRAILWFRRYDMNADDLVYSAHLQAVAYLIGETAVEKIVEEYT